MKDLTKYQFIRALRPFSLVVAVISTSLGVHLAWQQGHHYALEAILILIGGVLAQAGINLINDLEDLAHFSSSYQNAAQAQQLIYRNTAVGGLCFFLAALIAAWFISIHGWSLFFLVAFSAIAALNYNLGPINFKHRGAAVFQVFLLMGILMVQGAYLAMTGEFSAAVLAYSLPISLLVSLLLLSNELRDFDTDKALGISTFSVRLGYTKAVMAYWTLIICSYAIAIALLLAVDLGITTGSNVNALWLLIPLPLLWPLRNLLKEKNRQLLTPMTGRFFFLFGLAYMLALR